MDASNLVTVKQLAKLYPAFTVSTVRWWIFRSTVNGFEMCIVKIGRRVFIDLVAFKAWLNKHRVAQPKPAPVSG